MKGILKLFAILVGVFSTSFLLNSIYGWITPESVSASLEALRSSPNATLWLACIVIGVLAIDSVLAVPTITTIILSGYFLGPIAGGLAASAGVLLAGMICFFGSRFGGDRFFNAIVSPDEGARLKAWFESAGGLALLLSRSLPMLPEVLSCIAGMSGMRTASYLMLFAFGNIPFAFLAAWAGSRSSFEKPWPALLVGIGLPALAWIGWFAHKSFRKKQSVDAQAADGITNGIRNEITKGISNGTTT
ncbi:MAG: VTT domain-containing protein [bacterium]|nr:VTT domain-containing protein [bacterium]